LKFENIVKRISLSRESKRKNIMPFDNFFSRNMVAVRLLDFVEDEMADKEIRYEARKYIVIILASSMETYFKSMAQVFIDAGWVNEEFREILRRDKISLADLLEIHKKELSLGEIISVSHSLQDLNAVNYFFSKMLGVKDFLKELETIEIEPKNGKKYVLQSRYPDFRGKIEELLNLRHLIIHHEGFKGILGFDRLLSMAVRVLALVSAADNYLMEKIPED
jgi:hypothetical protein